MYEQLFELIRKYAEIPEGTDEQLAEIDLISYGLNSLTTINLVLDIEVEFNIQFPDDLLDFEGMTTPKGIYETLQTIILNS